MKKINIKSSPRAFAELKTVEQRHQMRLYLRQIRLLSEILSKIISKPEELKRIKSLRQFVKKLYLACGEVRDLDISIEILKEQKVHAPQIVQNLIKLRNQKQKKLLNKNHKIFRERVINENIWLQKLFKKYSKKLIDLIEIKIERKFKKIKESPEPRTITQWHSLRKKIRRLNYLLIFRGKKNNSLTKLQKQLGKLNDLNVLKKLIGNTRYIQIEQKQLIHKLEKQFEKL